MTPIDNTISSLAPEGISMFRSINEIAAFSFPLRLESMLLAVCKQGEISATIDVEQRTLKPGCILVLRPGHLISDCAESDDFEGFFIVVSENKLNELLPSLHYVIPYALHFGNNPIIELTPDELASQSLIYEMLNQPVWSDDRPFSSRALGALCEHLFYHTLGIYASRLHDVTVRTRREELLVNFIDLIELHFKKERTVNFYADKLFVTPKHLSSVLKEISGKTAGEWIDYRVILEAKLLLRTTTLNIQEISLELNFPNQSFFGKYFKHLTGMSPRTYRNNLSEI